MKDLISINRLKLLHPKAQSIFKAFIEECEQVLSITLRISEGYRTFAEQFNRYAQGRTLPGKIISYAPAGYSFHEYGLAIDLVRVMPDKSIDWAYNMQQLQSIADKYGITCGSRWTGKKVDPPHFEIHFGLDVHKLFDLRNAKQFIPGTNFVNIPKAA